MAICTVLLEKLYSILGWKEPRRQGKTQFFFQNVRNNDIFEIFNKMFKNNSWINFYCLKGKRL